MITKYNILSRSEALFYAELLKKQCTIERKDQDLVTGYSSIGYNLKEAILLHFELTQIAEKVFCNDLIPTYVYTRVYKRNSSLIKHKDRPQCEYSLTLNLGSSNNNISWPMEVYDNIKQDFLTQIIHCEPGEGIFYKGVEYPHSRLTPCPVDWYIQVFLHWVDQSGDYSSFVHESYVKKYEEWKKSRPAT